MMFLVIEMQKTTEGALLHLETTHKSAEEAESKYHTVLAAAAVSGLPVHAGVLLDEDGTTLRSECYKREE